MGYEHTASSEETAWSQTDSFIFDVWTQYVESALVSRLFTISLSYDNVNKDNVNWLMTLGTVTVREGAGVVISNSSLDVTPLNRHFVDVDVRYIVAETPRHGTLMNLSSGDEFTQRLIDSERLFYQHDGTDTAHDHFTFSLHITAARHQESDPSSSPSQTFSFNITVLPVDDQPFHLVTSSPMMELLQGSSHNITADMLLTLDQDTPPQQIVYTVNVPPTNGHLRHIYLPPTSDVTQFTQLDVNELQLSFVSDASLHNSTFYFHVSDGVHRPLHKVLKCLGGAAVRVLDFRPSGRGFDSRPGCNQEPRST